MFILAGIAGGLLVGWTWWPPEQKASFWSRRMAQETAVHRWDSEDAAGLATPLDCELAADGVEEMLAVHVPASETIYRGTPGTVRLVATDRVESWWVHLEVGAIPTFERSGQGSDATAGGSASDVLLFLWRRIEPSALRVEENGALVGDLWAYLETPGT